MDGLESLKNKVDDHDKSLMLMSKAVEDINKNLDRFVSSNEKLSSDMTKHWHVQDKTMDKLENILEKLSSNEVRFRGIEEKQINGCPNFLNFAKNRELELQHWKEVKNTILEAVKKNSENIADLISGAELTVEKIKVSNARMKDVETELKELDSIVKGHAKAFSDWKEKAYVAMIANALTVIGTMLFAAWAYFTN